MISIEIPGREPLRLANLVMDYNGTLACDGVLLPHVRELLSHLSRQITLYVVTADTFGKVRMELRGLPCNISVIGPKGQDVKKREFVEKLGKESVVAIGNGANDHLMLQTAALGIAVLQEEGAAVKTLLAAQVVCPSIVAAIELLTHPKRLVATLRT